jgi:hypothetical protein
MRITTARLDQGACVTKVMVALCNVLSTNHCLGAQKLKIVKYKIEKKKGVLSPFPGKTLRPAKTISSDERFRGVRRRVMSRGNNHDVIYRSTLAVQQQQHQLNPRRRELKLSHVNSGSAQFTSSIAGYGPLASVRKIKENSSCTSSWITEHGKH